MKIFCFFAFLSVFVFVLAKNDPKCGTNGPVQLKIIGGQQATPYEWPWAVSMGYNLVQSGSPWYFPLCTGSIIHRQFVLTSAKCVKRLASFKKEQKYMVFAAHNIGFEASEPRKITQNIGTTIIHPKYTQDSFGRYFNDVALIKLVSPLNISGNPDLGTICVPNQDETYNPYQGKLVTTIGWGATRTFYHRPSRVLIKTSLLVKSMDDCAKMYNIPKSKRNSMICTLKEKDGPCMYDEGGPLMLQESGKWTVVGTASYVRDDKCGEEKHPYMYAHISLYSDWIWKTVAENGG